MAEGQFKRGQSGNPSGRPVGARNKSVRGLDELAEGEALEIVRAMIDKAKQGDAVAAKPILDRIWPARKAARIRFDLPPISKAEELPTAIEAINRQVADGDLAPEEGAVIVGLIEAQRRAIETNELSVRLAALEERINPK